MSVRICVACRKESSRENLVRVVRTAGGSVEIQEEIESRNRHVKPLQGRGAYLCKKKECLELAKKHKRFERSLKGSLPQGFWESLEEQVE